MHDFILAKEIVEEMLKITKDKNLGKIKSVTLEIGSVALAHDGFPECPEDLNVENIRFGLESIAKNTILSDSQFIIKKTRRSDWRITNVEV